MTTINRFPASLEPLYARWLALEGEVFLLAGSVDRDLLLVPAGVDRWVRFFEEAAVTLPAHVMATRVPDDTAVIWCDCFFDRGDRNWHHSAVV
jgi:hypothetical protein